MHFVARKKKEANDQDNAGNLIYQFVSFLNVALVRNFYDNVCVATTVVICGPLPEHVTAIMRRCSEENFSAQCDGKDFPFSSLVLE